jgi:riboflavin kinase/FMN adenylyltransferase
LGHMIHTNSLDKLRLAGAALTVGAFDGVHRGHQELLHRLVQAARASSLAAAVVTFFPHPAVVLRGLQTPYYLTSPDERATLFEKMGIDVLVTLPFTRELAQVSATDFVNRLQSALNFRELWIGYDFALGRGREGDIPFLRRLGEKIGFQVHIVEPVALSGQPARPISSSQVRALLAEGDVSAAAGLLGRYYGFAGPVIHGDGRGRAIGIPTANVQPWKEQLLPRNGVYATWAWVEGSRRPSVTNIGFRPTFDSPIPAPRVEALLLDFDQDLYGKTVRLEFVRFLRPERRFDSVEALLDQITDDRGKAKEILAYDR